MAENKTRRMCFNLNGLLGGILATLLLLGILGYLVLWAVEVQKANATNFYELENPSAIQMNSTDSASHWKNK